jgi:exonuclease III
VPGYTPQERASFSKLLERGYVDTFRQLNPDRI